MKHLPYKKILIRSTLSQDEVYKRLSEITRPKQYSTFLKKIYSYPVKKYTGTVYLNSFKIDKIPEWRNSFAPIIIGKFEKRDNYIFIDIKLRLSLIILIFHSIWMSAVGLIFLGMLIVMIATNVFIPMILLPIVMFLFGYFICIIPFNIDSKQVIKEIQTLFEAEIIDQK